MAPYQCPKQVLIWSLPTLAVLISLFWYRRRKPSLKSDPGGKFAKATQPLHPVTTAVDNSCNGIKQTAAVAVNSETAVGELLTAIEKARRDFETAQPIEEEEAGAAASVRDVKEKQQLVASAASAAAAAVTSNHQTLTTSSNRTPIKKSTGVNGVVEESNQTVVSDKVCDIVKQVEQQIESVSVIENCEKIVEEGESDLSKVQQTGEQLKKSPVAEEVFTAVAVHKQEAAPGVGVVVDLDSSGLSDDCVIVDSKPPSPSEVSKSVVEEVIDLTSSSESLADVSAKLVDQKEQKMALEVEIKQPLMEQQQQLSSSDRSQLSAIGLDQSGGHTAHDDGERDSANHSPAEIMLESPALRNFSDVHSEGSSDSGKGCSDVATPPAGGSSVAGDGEPTAAGVFEFIIPQHLVGRLIGRHGAFLQEIRTTTHTNVFIKRHPDTAKLKICAIEGAQADIDAALSMIRHKFPLRRYPTLTLEKVTFVQVAPTCELAPDQFRLQLVEGVNNDVILSSLVSAGHMFLQQPTHPSFQQLAALNQVINANYCFNDSPSLDEPVKDGVCVAPAPMGGWYRAQIVNVNDDEKTVDLRFLDYGGYISCEYTILKKMRYDFLMLPFQAVECYLANITPVGGPGSVWSEEATLFVQNLIYGKILQAQIYDYMEDGMPLIYLYATCGNQVVLVNQELVASGYAEPVTPVAAAVAQPEQEVKVEE